MTKRSQLNLTPPQDLLTRLENLAQTYRHDPTRKNEIALEVLKDYLPLWELAAAAHVEYINKQRMDAALLALQGSGVEIVAKYANTNGPAARAIEEAAGDGPDDEVEQEVTDKEVEKAVREEQRNKSADKKGGAKGGGGRSR